MSDKELRAVQDDEYITDSDLEDDDLSVIEETFIERISALQDALPQPVRYAFTEGLSNITSAAGGVLRLAGSGLWILVTGAVIALLPTALEVEKEFAAISQEHAAMAQKKQAEQVLHCYSWLDGGCVKKNKFLCNQFLCNL
jgi:hypothetical protein